MDKYILIGITGCGKSTLGEQLAEILKIPFFDTDLMAYERLNLDNPLKIFMPSVANWLMSEQYNAMAELAEYNGAAVIATGAEVALIPKCSALMQDMGTIIHIKRDPETVIDSLQKSGRNRFVLRDEKHDTEIKIGEKAVELYAKELLHYETLADLTLINNGSEEEGIKKLMTLIQSEV